MILGVVRLRKPWIACLVLVAFAASGCGDIEGSIRDLNGKINSKRTLSLDNTALSISEGSAALISIHLDERRAVDTAVQVSFSSPRGDEGVDFRPVSTTLTIPAGQIAKTLPLETIDDTAFEGTEIFYLAISSPDALIEASPSTLNLTVTDNELAPSLTLADTSVVEGGVASFVATLSSAVAIDVSFGYRANSGGTAQSGLDYVALPAATLTIPAGSTAVTINVTTSGDALDESDETFELNLSAPTNLTIADAVAIGTITDDDSAPTLSFASAAQAVGEGVGMVAVVVDLSVASGQAVNVPFTVSGTAAGSGVDHGLASGTISIAAGMTSVTQTFSVVDDLVDESTETVILSLGSPTNASLGATQTHTVSITDDDGPPALTLVNSSAAEGNAVTFTVSLSAVSSQNISFTFNANSGGTATAGSDYTSVSGQVVTIPAGSSSVTVSVPTTSDSLDEPNEWFDADISLPVNASIASGTGTGTIADDDATPTLSIANSSATEAGSLTFTVSLNAVSGQDVTFTFTANSGGTATAGTDYTAVSAQVATITAGQTAATFVVVSTGDVLDEANETFNAGIADASNATIATGTASGTIVDDDATPSLSIAAASALEAGTITFTVTLSAASGQAVSFVFDANSGGTANAGTDYTAVTTRSVTIAAGQTTSTVAVASIGDSLAESAETFNAVISSPVNATLGTASAAGTIIDDDGAPSLSIAASSATEASAITFTVSLSAISGQEVTFTFNAGSGGNAVAGTDYTAVANQAGTIAAGQTTATFTVATLADALDEADETFTAAISSPTNTTISVASATGTIVDDDAIPSLSIGDTTITEAASGVFTVSLSAASGRDVLFDWATSSGTAGTGDFTAASGSGITIPAGGTTATLTVATLSDALDEIDETFTVGITTPVNATISDNSGLGTITDDDATPALAIANSSATESANLIFTITLGAASGQDVTFTFNANSGGNAVAGTDYSAITNQVLTISAGQTAVTTAVSSLGDTIDEADETFSAAISGPANATIGTASATGTISDDDLAPQISIAASSATEAGTVTFTITQNAVSGQDVTFTFNANSGGTATAGTDYTGVSNLLLTISAGSTQVTANVVTLTDVLDESDETFTAAISGPSNATLGTSSVAGTIDDDDGPPSLSLASSSVTEGGAITFTITQSALSGLNTTFTFNANSGGNAVLGTDYTGVSNQLLTITAGQTSVTTTVATTTDTLDEANETFDAVISGPTNANLSTGSATGTINDDDGAPTISIANATVTEGGVLVFTVSLSAASGQNVRFDWATADGTAAAADSDFSSGSGNDVVITAGTTSATLSVSTGNDSKDEANETLSVTLSDLVNAAAGATSATGTITDDDSAPTLQFSAATQNTSGVESGNVVVTLTISTASGLQVSAPITVNGSSTAADPADYSISAGAVTIPAGSTSASLTISVASDSLDEANETIILDLGAVTNASAGSQTSQTITLDDDDAAPSISISTASATEAGTITFTITASAVSGRDITFTFDANSGGTATAGTDYTSVVNRLLTISAGSTEVTTNVVTLGDVLGEVNETFTAAISSPSNATLGTSSADGTITDDDGAPTLNISGATVTEGGNLVFTASLSSTSGVDVTFDWTTADGTATLADSDYSSSSGSDITITAGQSSVTFTVATGTDTKDEDNETLSVTASDVQQAASGTLTGTGTINDDDAAPSIQFSAATQNSAGVESGNITVQLALSAASGKQIVVPLTVNGASTAASPADYSLSALTVTIAPGGTTASVTLTVATDAVDEENETVILNLGALTNASAGAQNSQTITIDDDDAMPSISIAAATATEASNIVFTITQTPASGRNVVFTFNANSGGNAAAGTDYTAVTNQVLTITAGTTSVSTTIATQADALDEANETFTASISGPSNATLGTSSVSGTITDDDATPSISIAGSSATEASGIVFTITPSAISGQDIVFTFNANSGGSAVAGTDYTGVTNQVVTIPAGSANVTTTVSTSSDTLDEANETFTATISGASNATIGTSSGTGTITDDDASPSISIAASSATEANAIVFTITPSAVSGQDIVFTFNANSGGSAVAGTDYTGVSNSVLTIVAGATSVTATVTSLADSSDEADETFTAAISGAGNATLGTSSVSGTILDDDAAPAISIASSSAAEGSNIVFTITPDVVSGKNITFTFNANSGGNATAGTDYTSVVNQVLTIAAGSTNTIVSVSTVGDTTDEANETFTAAISGATNASLGTSSATGTIIDDDSGPAISIAASSATEGSGVIFTITPGAVSEQEITFTFNANSGGTAIAGTDYTGVTGRVLTISASAANVTTTVSTIQDATDEANETFTATISGPTNATLGTSSVSGTISDDDSPPSISIAAGSATEGSGIVFTITPSAVSGQDINLTFNANSGGNAVAGTDYTAVNNRLLTISAGATDITTTVTTAADALDEFNETFTASISGPTNATLGTSSASGTIVDNNGSPVISIAASAATEASGLVFTITSNAVSGRDITFTFNANSGGTATAGTDYTSVTDLVLTIPEGSTSVVTTVTSLTDTIDEPNETFMAAISGASGAGLGTSSVSGTINDDDNGPTISISNASANEGSNLDFVVTLGAASGQQVTFSYASSAGSATAGTDYTNSSGTGTISAGTTAMTISVAATNDSVDEWDETLTIAISSPANATLGTSSATGTIYDATLFFNFMTGVLHSGLTYTRTGSATYFDSNGVLQTASANTPRFDYDPASGQLRGLLVEKNRINSITYSEQFDHANWTKFGTTVSANSSGTTAPDGTQTADFVIESSANESHYTMQTVASVNSLHFTYTVFAKSPPIGGRPYVNISIQASSNIVAAKYNLAAGTVSSSQTSGTGANVAASIQPVKNGWYRLRLSGQFPSGATNVSIYNGILAADGGAATHQGNGTSGTWFWGAQFELATSIPSSYIATTSAAAARASDFVSANNFGTWYNASEWTTIVDFSRAHFENPAEDVYPLLYHFGNTGGAYTERIYGVYGSLAQRFSTSVVYGGTFQGGSSGATATFLGNAIYQVGSVKSGSTVQQFENGAANTVSGSLTIGTMNDLGIGNYAQINQAGLSGHIRRLTYRPRAISAAVAQALTSDDAVQVSFREVAKLVPENEPTVRLTATLNRVSASQVTVPFALSGTATGSGTDYSISATTITIPAGSLEASATITLTSDAVIEADETIIATVGTPVNATALAPTVETITILNDDATPPALSIADNTATEAGTITFTITQDAVSTSNVVFTFNANSGGDATAGTDYTSVTNRLLTITAGQLFVTTNVVTLNDTADEVDETFSAVISGPTNATISDNTGVGTITDDDLAPTVQFVTSATSTGGPESGTLALSVSLSTASGKQVIVPVTVNGSSTATNSTDYTLSATTMTIAAGNTFGSINFTVTTDTVDEPDETLILDLGAPTNATAASPTSMTITINDDDTAPSISIAASSATEAGTITFTISPSVVSGQNITFTFNANSGGNAIAGTDYTSVTNRLLTISAGSSNVTTTVVTLTDALDELNETFTAAISGATNATLGTASVSGTINDDDATPTISIAASSVVEGGSLTFTITPSAVSGQNITFTFNANSGGTATSGTDYTAATNVLVTITAGASNATTTVAATADSTDEASETFTASISGAAGATLSTSSVTGTIEDAVLYFDFTTGSLPSGLTFTRASTATYFDSSGVLQIATANTPRYDYDPARGQLRGLLLERGTTNSALQSEAFNTTWTTNGVTVLTNSTGTTAPDGTQTAEFIQETTANSSHFVRQSGVSVNSSVFTYTVFAKMPPMNGRRYVGIHIQNVGATSGVDGQYDLASGIVMPSAFTFGTGTDVVSSIQPVGNGWYRLRLTGRFTSGTTTVNIANNLEAVSGSTNYTGNGASGAWFWGAQMEVDRSVPSSYIPTTTAAVTRSAELLVANSFATWFNASNWTAVADVSRPYFENASDTQYLYYFSFDIASYSDRISNILSTDDGINYGGAVLGNVAQGESGTYLANIPNNIYQSALIKSGSTLQHVANGTAAAATGSLSFPTPTRLSIGTGGNGSGGAEISGYLRKFTYRARALSSATVQSITTDDPIQVSFREIAKSAPESAGTILLTAALERTTASQVTVPFTLSGTATGSGTDYTVSATTITIAAGALEGSATITLTNDSTVESDETIIATIGTPTNAAKIAPMVETISILNDDVAPPALSIADGSATEAGTITFTITQDTTSASNVTFTFNANSGGNATAGTDYTSVTNRLLTITAGQTSVTTTVVTLTDTADELDETFNAVISGATNATISDNTGVGTITDDDATPSISIAASSATEAGTITFTISPSVVSGQEITFTFNANSGGNATAGTDYTSVTNRLLTITAGASNVTTTVVTLGDTKDELNETFTAAISGPSATATLGTASASGTITDDDATPTISIAASSATEAGTITFTIAPSAVSGQEITFTFNANSGGNATAGTDYTSVTNRVLTIAADAANVTTTVVTLTDALDELDETFTAAISGPSASATLGTASVSGTITDDDATPTISIAAASATEAGTITFTITPSAVSGQAITFTFNANSGGNATAGTDYTSVTNRLLTITAGSSNVTTSVVTLTDALDEPNETFTAAISGPSAAATLGTASVSGTITDDDATPSISIAASSVVEAGTMTFTITPSAVSGQAITFTFNANSGGTATSGTDYTSVTNRLLTITTGASNVTTTVVTLTDTTPEANETFNAVISGASGATLGTSTITGTIYDDDIVQQAYVKAANVDAGDVFGESIAIDGDTMVVGAPGEASNQTTITNGATASSDNSKVDAGAVYVYVRSGTTWTQQAYIKAPNSDAGDRFGHSVAIDGDTIIVGAHQEDSNQTSITNGTTAPANNLDSETGAAYIFVRSGTTWTQQAYLKASTLTYGLGYSVAIDGDTAAAGAVYGGVAGGGEVVVFTRSGTTWSQQAQFSGANADTGDMYARSIDLSGDTLVVGSVNESSNQTTITNGTTASSDNSLTAAGAVYVYLRTGTTWAQQAYIKAANAGFQDTFGTSVAIDGNTLVVGTDWEDSSQTSVTNGTSASSDNTATDAGAAYVYLRTGTTWAQQAYLKPTNMDAYDGFGLIVDISGDKIVVGSYGEDSNQATISSGSTSSADDSMASAGAAYLFSRNGTTWSQWAYLKAPNVKAGKEFGYSAAISAGTVVVGSHFESSNQATITNGTTASSNETLSNPGAAYIFVGAGQ